MPLRAGHTLTLISRHLVLIRIDHIAVNGIGGFEATQIGTLIARAHAAIASSAIFRCCHQPDESGASNDVRSAGETRTWRSGSIRTVFGPEPDIGGSTARPAVKQKREARMRVAGPLTNTGTAPGPLGRCSDER